MEHPVLSTPIWLSAPAVLVIAGIFAIIRSQVLSMNWPSPVAVERGDGTYLVVSPEGRYRVTGQGLDPASHRGFAADLKGAKGLP